MSAFIAYRRRLAVPAAVLSLAFATAACGGDDGGEEGNDGSGSTGAAEVLGSEDAAAGETVKIGWLTTGQTQAIDTTEQTEAAEAVVAYANERLGGLGGRPIELLVCEEKGTPAGAQACAVEFIREEVNAVVFSTSSVAEAAVQGVVADGIPVAANVSAVPAILQSPGAFVFGNPVASFGTPAAYARENDIGSAAMIVIDVPAASGPAKTLAPTFFENAGSSVNVIGIPPGTADMTPQIQNAENDDPDMFHVLGDPTFCTTALSAIRTLAIDKPILIADTCIGPAGAGSIPGGLEGVDVVASSVAEEGSEDYELFTAVLDTYSDGLEPNALTIGGFQAMLSFVRAVNESGTTDVSRAAITTALQEMPETPYPLGGGETFQCNGEALPAISPNICSAVGFVAEASADGTLSNFSAVDTEGIYVLN
jgi:branched-chain amino acid transport system substrate-binding protein